MTVIPGSSQTWQNTGNVASSDNVYSNFGSIAPANGYTDYLVVTNFGFNIPPGSSISGIVVEIERSDANSRTIDNSIRLVQGGVISGDDKAVSATYPLTDAYQTYGNAGDTWGLTWIPADINASNFGVAISARKINAANGTAAGKIDNVIITVYYDFVSLPVDLISFSAVKNSNAIALNWTTVNEIDMTFYEIQRSDDGFNFSTIASIPSQNRSAVTRYNFEDVNPPGSILYYRLKMTGLSGYSKYSKIISVNCSNDKSITFYPNPVHNSQNLHIANRNNQTLMVRFYDQSGRMLWDKVITSDEIYLSALSAQKGIIIYRIFNPGNQLITTGKLVLQ